MVMSNSSGYILHLCLELSFFFLLASSFFCISDGRFFGGATINDLQKCEVTHTVSNAICSVYVSFFFGQIQVRSGLSGLVGEGSQVPEAVILFELSFGQVLWYFRVSSRSFKVEGQVLDS